MTNEEAKICIDTIEMLRRLHGVMNVIDAGDFEKIIKVLSDIPKYKDAYNKGWDDGANATYEHLKMCEEEQSGNPVSREAVCEIINDIRDCISVEGYCAILERMKKLPSVNPQEPKTGHCKDCKWWKDSDGIYRRGIRAESNCPFNTKEIYDGDAYCYRFAPQERSEKE